MSTVAKKVIMGSGAVAEFAIDQSIIYDSASDSQMYFDPSSNFTSETVFTFSTWAKRASNGASQRLLTAGYYASALDQSGMSIQFHSSDVLRVNFKRVGGVTYNNQNIESTALFRDPAAWYHILVTRNGTAIKGYVNGVEVLSGTMTANSVVGIQNTYPVMVGVSSKPTSSAIGAYESFNGNLAETHFIDGTVKATSDFGETNEDTNQWIPKEYTGGSYGTNGFYLKFVSGALGTDSSGQGNTMTVANLADSDVVIDTPMNNFCTLNPLDNVLPALSEGNTNTGTAGANSWKMARSTFELTTGKWYWEMKWTGNTVDSSNGYQMGLKTPTSTLTAAAAQAGSFAFQATEIYSTNGSTNTVTISPGSATTGQNDIIMFAYDADAGKMWIGVNGTWTSSGDPAAGSNNQWASIPTTGVSPFAGIYGSNISMDCNFGQKTYAYTPPSGFVALSTANLPDPAIALPSEHFNTVLYAGTGSAQTISGVGFQPDFLWIKCRSAATWHNIRDAVRGNNKEIFSNTDYVEVDAAAGARAMTFESDGFAWGSDSGDVNGSGRNYVSWNWKANGSGSTDTSGDIDAVVSANQAAGFSIITWTGDGGAHTTVPHGLGVAPEIIFEKYRNATGNWYTWLTVIDGTNDFLRLDLDSAAGDAGASGTPTSQFFSNWGSPSGRTNVAYAFVSKPGFSKIGVYAGNNAADGPFVNLGFRPAWVMVKRADAGNEWIIVDVKRDIDNVASHRLFPNLTDAESTSQSPMDILSNGFKLKISAGIYNAAGTYLYMAFAESPFKYANAR